MLVNIFLYLMGVVLSIVGLIPDYTIFDFPYIGEWIEYFFNCAAIYNTWFPVDTLFSVISTLLTAYSIIIPIIIAFKLISWVRGRGNMIMTNK